MTKDRSRFCLTLGDWCYKECSHYYYRDFNKCCRKPEEKRIVEEELNGKKWSLEGWEGIEIMTLDNS